MCDIIFYGLVSQGSVLGNIAYLKLSFPGGRSAEFAATRQAPSAPAWRRPWAARVWRRRERLMCVVWVGTPFVGFERATTEKQSYFFVGGCFHTYPRECVKSNGGQKLSDVTFRLHVLSTIHIKVLFVDSPPTHRVLHHSRSGPHKTDEVEQCVALQHWLGVAAKLVWATRGCWPTQSWKMVVAASTSE